jgi:hypothetical protein
MVWRWLAFPALLLFAGLLWYVAADRPITRHSMVAPDEDQQRIDAQQQQIQMLNQRVEMLEIKVTALQKLAGYQTLDGDRLPAVPDPLASPQGKKPATPAP